MSASIVLAICSEHDIAPADFFSGGTGRHLVQARVAAIHRLRDAGFNQAAVARLIRREYSVVRYWLHPEYRARKKLTRQQREGKSA